MAAPVEKHPAERHQRELRVLRTTLAGSCASALRMIESRPAWAACTELRQLWAQFAEAKDALLRPPSPERLPPKPPKPVKRRLGEEPVLGWAEVIGER
jgi:hypothetical protein